MPFPLTAPKEQSSSTFQPPKPSRTLEIGESARAFFPGEPSRPDHPARAACPSPASSSRSHCSPAYRVRAADAEAATRGKGAGNCGPRADFPEPWPWAAAEKPRRRDPAGACRPPSAAFPSRGRWKAPRSTDIACPTAVSPLGLVNARLGGPSD